MNKVLFIANIGHKNKLVPNGVNIKNRHILKYLQNIKDIKVKVIDTENWKVRFFELLFKILLFSCLNKKIVLSINTKSAYQIIRFLHFFNLDKKLLYIVVGGSLPSEINKGNLKKKYYKNILKIYVQTKKMEKDLKLNGFTNIERLPNSKYFDEIKLDTKKEIGSPINCFYLGRIHPDKGIDLIFEALNKVNKKECKFSIDFYGPIEKNYQEYFLKEVSKFNFTSYLGTLNLIDNMESYYQLAKYDLFIFPTYWDGEGFPGVVIDSYISGVPVLASDWNHNEEVIENGYNGIIFKSKDINHLIYELEHIYENKSILIELSKNARKSSENYKSENVLKVLENYLIVNSYK